MTSKPASAMTVELEDRDPNNLNQHLQIVWDDIVGEPEGARSPECAWRVSGLVFRHARNICYGALTVLLAPPAALLLGCCFALLAFEQIWFCAPFLRVTKICCASTRTFMRATVSALVVPVVEAIGYMCRNIRINNRNEANDDADPLIV